MSAQQRGPVDGTFEDLLYTDPRKAFGKAMEELQHTQDGLSAVREKIQRKPIKVTTKDGMISITLDAGGDVASIVFNTQKFRRMAPAELGAVLVEAITRARAEGRAQLAEAYAPFLPEGFDLQEVMSGKFSTDGIFESARQRSEQVMAAVEPAGPARKRKG
jgi:DNA-binding protein YbaB